MSGRAGANTPPRTDIVDSGKAERVKAVANSCAVGNRSLGLLASAVMTASSIQRGKSDLIVDGFGGSSVNRLTNPSFPANGGLPVNISKRTQPRLYVSLRPSRILSPISCSGLMYARVPG